MRQSTIERIGAVFFGIGCILTGVLVLIVLFSLAGCDASPPVIEWEVEPVKDESPEFSIVVDKPSKLYGTLDLDGCRLVCEEY